MFDEIEKEENSYQGEESRLSGSSVALNDYQKKP